MEHKCNTIKTCNTCTCIKKYVFHLTAKIHKSAVSYYLIKQTGYNYYKNLSSSFLFSVLICRTETYNNFPLN